MELLPTQWLADGYLHAYQGTETAMLNTRHLALVLGLSLSLAACGGGRAPQTTSSRAQTMLEVQNDSYLDHNVYLLQGLQRVRMGTARGLATSRFEIPRQYVFGVSSLQFIADPIGSNVTPVSERISVSPGDVVVLQILSRP
jgi:hypothetical protein